MAQGNDEAHDLLRRIFSNPVVTTGLALASVMLLPLALKTGGDTHEARERRAKRIAEDRARREQDKRDHEQRQRRAAARNEYLSTGEGRTLLEERAYIRIGPERPISDAVYTKLRGGFRSAAFAVESHAARPNIHVSWDVADKTGTLVLQKPDGTEWRFGFGFGFGLVGQTELMQYLPGPPIDVESATLAAKLLATDGSPFNSLVLVRPEYKQIESSIWREYLAAHPELGEEYSDKLRRWAQARRAGAE